MAGLNPRIKVETGKMGGKPCIRGLRFTVYDLASYLASGMKEDEILTEFPYLEKQDFQAVYEFFASIPLFEFINQTGHSCCTIIDPHCNPDRRELSGLPD